MAASVRKSLQSPTPHKPQKLLEAKQDKTVHPTKRDENSTPMKMMTLPIETASAESSAPRSGRTRELGRPANTISAARVAPLPIAPADLQLQTAPLPWARSLAVFRHFPKQISRAEYRDAAPA